MSMIDLSASWFFFPSQYLCVGCSYNGTRSNNASEIMFTAFLRGTSSAIHGTLRALTASPCGNDKNICLAAAFVILAKTKRYYSSFLHFIQCVLAAKRMNIHGISSSFVRIHTNRIPLTESKFSFSI